VLQGAFVVRKMKRQCCRGRVWVVAGTVVALAAAMVLASRDGAHLPLHRLRMDACGLYGPCTRGLKSMQCSANFAYDVAPACSAGSVQSLPGRGRRGKLHGVMTSLGTQHLPSCLSLPLAAIRKCQ
jgi:hypothetical protein